jgi:hypothetical protein
MKLKEEMEERKKIEKEAQQRRQTERKWETG